MMLNTRNGTRALTMAVALAFSISLAACNQPGQNQQAGGAPMPAPGDGSGGYGPFGGETPPTNAPSPFQQPMQPGMQPDMQPTGPGGAETVLAGGGGGVPAEFQQFLSNTLDSYSRSIVPNWSRVQSVPDTMTGLPLGGEHVVQVSLRGGQRYAFIGACDNDCSNIDLTLQDGSGATIDADVLADDYPAVDVTPPADGVYTVRLQMRACTNAPCYVGIRLLHG